MRSVVAKILRSFLVYRFVRTLVLCITYVHEQTKDPQRYERVVPYGSTMRSFAAKIQRSFISPDNSTVRSSTVVL